MREDLGAPRQQGAKGSSDAPGRPQERRGRRDGDEEERRGALGRVEGGVGRRIHEERRARERGGEGRGRHHRRTVRTRRRCRLFLSAAGHARIRADFGFSNGGRASSGETPFVPRTASPETAMLDLSP